MQAQSVQTIVLVDDILSSYNKKEETFEDFGVNGSFTITSVNLNS